MSGSEVGAIVIAQLIGGLVGALIGSLIGAILLRAASKWVAKLDVPFGKAYWTIFISFVVNFVLGFVLGFVVGATGSIEAIRVLQVILLPVGFLIQSGIISSRLELSFGKACLINITMVGIALGITLVVGLLIFLIMQATGSF